MIAVIVIFVLILILKDFVTYEYKYELKIVDSRIVLVKTRRFPVEDNDAETPNLESQIEQQQQIGTPRANISPSNLSLNSPEKLKVNSEMRDSTTYSDNPAIASPNSLITLGRPRGNSETIQLR